MALCESGAKWELPVHIDGSQKVAICTTRHDTATVDKQN